MKELLIGVNRKGDGVVFWLTLAMRRILKESFPEAKAAAKIFVGYDQEKDFSFYHGSIERFICPALIGMDIEKCLEKITGIVFINPLSKEVIYKIDKVEV